MSIGNLLVPNPYDITVNSLKQVSGAPAAGGSTDILTAEDVDGFERISITAPDKGIPTISSGAETGIILGKTFISPDATIPSVYSIWNMFSGDPPYVEGRRYLIFPISVGSFVSHHIYSCTGGAYVDLGATAYNVPIYLQNANQIRMRFNDGVEEAYYAAPNLTITRDMKIVDSSSSDNWVRLRCDLGDGNLWIDTTGGYISTVSTINTPANVQVQGSYIHNGDGATATTTKSLLNFKTADSTFTKFSISSSNTGVPRISSSSLGLITPAIFANGIDSTLSRPSAYEHFNPLVDPVPAWELGKIILAFGGTAGGFTDRFLYQATGTSDWTELAELFSNSPIYIESLGRVMYIIQLDDGNYYLITAAAVNAQQYSDIPALRLTRSPGPSGYAEFRLGGTFNHELWIDTRGNVTRFVDGERVSIDNTVDATSTLDGSLHLEGGMGVKKTIYAASVVPGSLGTVTTQTIAMGGCIANTDVLFTLRDLGGVITCTMGALNAPETGAAKLQSNVGTIPSAYRPAANTEICCPVSDNGTTECCSFLFYAGGAILVTDLASPTGNFSGLGNLVIAEHTFTWRRV